MRALMNSREPISGLDSPSRASRAIWASWMVSRRAGRTGCACARSRRWRAAHAGPARRTPRRPSPPACRSGAQLLARVVAAALPAQPFPVQQMGAGQVDAEPGPGEAGDRLAVQALGQLTVTHKCARSRLDAERPLGVAGAGHLVEPVTGTGRGAGEARACGGLDQLDRGPEQRAKIVIETAGTLRCSQRLVVMAEAVVERGVGPLGERDPDSLAAPGHILDGGFDQGERPGLIAAKRGQRHRAVGREMAPGRFHDRLHLVGEQRRSGQLTGEQQDVGA